MNKKKEIYIHIDADAFFASVEQCLHRELKGKPVVAGRDGSIGVALSYEAKALGVKRALPIHIIREEFPEVQMVASDYYMYRIFSNRMLNIIGKYIPDIARKSIDECSACITTLVNSFDEAKNLATELQNELQLKLDCSFSFGISSSALLAKMASGMNKPHGITILNPENTENYYSLPIERVPGLGKRLCERVRGLGVHTVGQFLVEYPRIARNFSITVTDIYNQLQGFPSTRILLNEPQKSMNRSRSFKVTTNHEEVFGQVTLNLEHLTRKLRNQNLCGTTLYISLRRTDRSSVGSKLKLPRKMRDFNVLLEYARIIFDECRKSGEAYRYVSVTISGLHEQSIIQTDIFGNVEQDKHYEKVLTAVDYLNDKFGKPLVVHASSMITPKKLGTHRNPNTHPITEVYPFLPGESVYKRLRYPYLGRIS
ncbi:hypothetical protein CL684_00120 [Candidatus Campbellbacteria bacterium]|nr:hypothetical protein [Candidatus Campbellbacteria bacterium]|tara:strand:+ start:49 stop:1326 length:1278 start_codon:yes stop_codon:yes gene_type:complete